MKRLISVLVSILLIISSTESLVTAFAVADVNIETIIKNVAELQENFAQTDEEYKEFVQSRLIVNAERLPISYGETEVIWYSDDTYIFSYSDSSSAGVAKAYYESLDYVNWVEFDVVYETQSLSYGNDILGTDSAKAYIENNNIELNEVDVAILDSGINFKRTYFKESGRIFDSGVNLSSSGTENSAQYDGNYHGSHVTSIILDNTTSNVNIIGYKVTNKEGKTTATALSTAINLAVEDGVDIINLSLGGTSESTLLEQAIKNAYDKGVIIVVSAGNNGADTVNCYPASYEEVFTVAAMDKNGNRAYFSNFGDEVDFIAPGYQVQAQGNKDVELVSGTSFSAPFITSAVAMSLSVNPNYSPKEIKQELIDSCIQKEEIIFQSPYYSDIEIPTSDLYGYFQEDIAETEDLYYGYGLPQIEELIGKTETKNKPSFGVNSGIYNSEFYLSITASKNDEIYYTTDGSYPSKNNGVLYTEPFLIDSTVCIRAIAYSQNKTKSVPTMLEIKMDYPAAEEDFEIDERGYITSYSGELKEIIVPETINGKTVCGVGEYAFYDDRTYDEIKEMGDLDNFIIGITLPDTVTEIEDFAFFNPLIKYITAPGLKTVGESGLDSNIIYLDAPNIEYIGIYGLACNIPEINLEKCKTAQANAFSANPFLKSVNLPNLTVADEQLFEDCFRVTDINLPLAKDVREGAFKSCYQLKNINLDNVEIFSKTSTTPTIYTFESCRSLTELSCPKLTAIEIPICFYWCNRLHTVDFPELTVLSEGAFGTACSELRNVNAPKLTTICNKAFTYTNSLTELYLPSLEIMGDEVFTGSALKKLIAPNLIELGNMIFTHFSRDGYKENLKFEYLYAPKLRKLSNASLSYMGAVRCLDLKELKVLGNPDSENNNLTNTGIRRLEFSSIREIYELPHNNYYAEAEGLPITIEFVFPASLSYCVPVDNFKSTNDNYIVYGTKDKNTYAEEWAQENNIEFINLSPETAVVENIAPIWDDCSCEPLVFDARGFNRTYQWYGSYDNTISDDDIDIEGANSNEFDPDEKNAFPYYYCKMVSTDINCDGEIVKSFDVYSSICENKLYKAPQANITENIVSLANGTVTNSKLITFVAVGSNMNLFQNIDSATKFEPVFWYVTDELQGDFKNGDYTVTYMHTDIGTYNLIVVFEKFIYNENSWQSTGETDTKTVNYTIEETHSNQPQELYISILELIFKMISSLLQIITNIF